MVEPYAAGLSRGRPAGSVKGDVVARLVTILAEKRDQRQLQLIAPGTRAVQAGEVHELIITDEPDAAPGKEVNSIAYIGFASILNSGMIMLDDEVVLLGGKRLGRVVGFDLSHAPNHMNIVIYAPERKTGPELGLRVGTALAFIDPSDPNLPEADRG